jgi:hypothetical protein
MPAPDGAGMRTAITALTIVTLLALTPVDASAPAPLVAKSGDTSSATKLLVEGAPSPSDRLLVRWATGRFAEAGLDLPTAVVVEFAAEPSRCGGNTGIAVHGEVFPRIVLCTSGSAEVVVARTLLHELAHLWAEASLSDEDRGAFLELRGLEAWGDGPWVARGSEHAAEIVTWALMDRELTMLTLPEHDPSDLAAGYRLLTGSSPPPRDS